MREIDVRLVYIVTSNLCIIYLFVAYISTTDLWGEDSYERGKLESIQHKINKITNTDSIGLSKIFA